VCLKNVLVKEGADVGVGLDEEFPLGPVAGVLHVPSGQFSGGVSSSYVQDSVYDFSFNWWNAASSSSIGGGGGGAKFTI
jgi:hypothetical protein